MSLSHKALLAVIAVFLPVVITIFAGYKSNKENLEKLIFNNFTVIAEEFEKVIYQFLEMNRRRVQDFSSDGFISDQLVRIVKGENKAVVLLNEHLVRNKLPLDKTIHSIYIITLNGIVAASTDPSSIGKDVTGEQFFINIKKGKMITDNIQGFEDLLTICAASPLKNRDTGEPIGVIASFISLDELGRVISGDFFREMGAITTTKGMLHTMEAYVVDSDKMMITKSRFIKKAVLKQKVETTPVEACLKSNTEMTGFYKDYRGVDVIGSSMCIPSLKWTILVEVDKSEIDAPLIQIKKGVIALFVAVSGFIGILFFIFQKAVIAPLNRASNAAKEIARGNLKVTIPVQSGDEIGTLSESFNRMARELEDRTQLLKRSESSLTEAQRIAHIGNWSWNIGTNELDWSAEIYRIFGFRPHEFKASYEAFLNCIHPDDRDLVIMAINDALHDKKTYSIDHRIVLPDGSQRIVHEQAEVVLDITGKPAQVVGTVQDITEQRKMEALISRARRMESVGALAGGIAHDFNNILTIIMGYAGNLQEKIDKDSPMQSDVDQILKSVRRGANLTKSLLVLGKKQDITLKEVDINEVIKTSEALFLKFLKKDVELRVDLNSEKLMVMADVGHIENVLINLAMNAKDAMPDGGRLSIETSLIQPDNAFIKAFGQKDSKRYALISISDTGIGMDEKTKMKIFEPFFTTKEEGKGTGLGLTMVYGTIKQHNGFIDIQSEPGKGSTFNIYLPLIESRAV